MYSIACIAGKEKGKRGRALGPGKDLKMGQLTLGKGLARMGIRNHVLEEAIPSKGPFFYILNHNIACNIIIHVPSIKRKYSFCTG
jgi:hypothetical protein